ncbi:MAG: hypothetical protein Q8M24_20390 [Pseudolabrys sp.]|nr:hypothetical protein [Pseudolabrys sp.]MDP2297810.1 hypothetical protein [Pseudolabrys sp.]
MAANALFSIIERDSPVAIAAPFEILKLNGTAKKTLRRRRRAPRAWRRALLCIAAVVALSLSVVERGFAENPWAKSRNIWGSSPNAWGNSQNTWGRSPSPKAGNGAPSNFGGYVAVPSEGIVALPSIEPRGGKYIDGGAIPDGLQASRHPPKRTARYLLSDAPAGNGRRQFAPRHSRKPPSLKEPK